MSSIPATLTFSRALVFVVLVFTGLVLIVHWLAGGRPRLSGKETRPLR
jgi:1-acyl-sn-glycerol-3-phosphate acyltransferase